MVERSQERDRVTGRLEATGPVEPSPRAGPAGRQRGRLRPGAKQTFTSLGHRNYRLWFTGQATSLLGSWMQMTAQGFLIFQLTGSPVYLGYVGFAAGLPIWLFSLFGGVATDRLRKRDLLLATQVSMMILAFVLAALAFAGWVQPWHVIVLAFLGGIANAFDAPARQAFVIELVPREDIGNAIALNSTMVNLGSAFGPAVGGLVYAALGPGWCFTINGISFLAIIAGLLMMRLQPHVPPTRKANALAELKDGLRYVRTHETIRVLIALLTVSTIFGMGFATLLPDWAVKILGGDATTNGFLQSGRGLGSLIGALMIASLGRITYKGRVLTLGTVAYPIFTLVFAAMRWLPLSMLMLVGIGWGSMLMMNMCSILVQQHVTDEFRGRVMSIYTLAFFGMFPISALLAGASAEIIGEPFTVALGALVTLAFAGWLWLRIPRLRALE